MKTMVQQVVLARFGGAFALLILSGCGVLLGGYGDEPPAGAGGNGGAQESASTGSAVGGAGGGVGGGAGGGAGGGTNTGGGGNGCEAIPIKVALGETMVPLLDSTMAEKNLLAPVTTGNCVQTTSGPERVYAVTVGSQGILTAMTKASGTMFDSVLYARKGSCTDTAVEVCADRSSGMHDLFGGEVLSFPVEMGDVWYVVVDGYDDVANGKGGYELSLSLATGRDSSSVIPVRFELGSTMTLHGAVGELGENDVWTATCGGLGEIIYQVEYGTGVKKLQFDAFPLLTTLNPALYATTSAPDNFVTADAGCDSKGCGVAARISTTPGINYVVVDGALPGFPNCMDASPGAYNLIVTPSATP